MNYHYSAAVAAWRTDGRTDGRGRKVGRGSAAAAGVPTGHDRGATRFSRKNRATPAMTSRDRDTDRRRRQTRSETLRPSIIGLQLRRRRRRRRFNSLWTERERERDTSVYTYPVARLWTLSPRSRRKTSTKISILGNLHSSAQNAKIIFYCCDECLGQHP